MALQLCMLSHQLLTHDGLMTPVLQAKFGDIAVTGARHQYEDAFLIRHSTLVQQASQQRVLDATLHISVSDLPAGLVEKLFETPLPFGQLLVDHHISVYATGRKVFQAVDDKTKQERWGRQLDLRSLTSHQVLCSVKELLVTEQALKQIAQRGPNE